MAPDLSTIELSASKVVLSIMLETILLSKVILLDFYTAIPIGLKLWNTLFVRLILAEPIMFTPQENPL